MSFYRFSPFRDDYHRGRHHDEGIVNNLIVNVQEEYRPQFHYVYPQHHHCPFWPQPPGESIMGGNGIIGGQSVQGIGSINGQSGSQSGPNIGPITGNR